MQIDAPNKEFLTAKEAATRIGIDARLFVKLAEREDWMRPVLFGLPGKRPTKKWPRLDIWVFCYIFQRRQPPPENT